MARRSRMKAAARQAIMKALRKVRGRRRRGRRRRRRRRRVKSQEGGRRLRIGRGRYRKL